MHKYNLILSFLLLALCLSFTVNAKEKNRRAASCQLISSSQAISLAQARMSGKVLSVKLSRATGQPVYRVRMLVGKKRIKNISIKACR